MDKRWAKKVLMLMMAAVILLIPVTPRTAEAQKSNNSQLGGPGSGSSSALDCAIRDSGDYTFDWYGTVINHQTNKPIPKITIKATLPSGKVITAISGSDGKYAFTPGLQLGQSSAKVPVSLSGNDYQTEEYVINVTPGKFSKDLLLDEKFNEANTGYKRLYSRIMSGRVVNPGGFLPFNPIANAVVSLYDSRNRNLVAEATTDSYGVYYLTQTPSANIVSQNVDYYLEATLNGIPIASTTGVTSDKLRFIDYPGGPTIDSLKAQEGNNSAGVDEVMPPLIRGLFVVGLTTHYQGTPYTYPLSNLNNDLTVTQNDVTFSPLSDPYPGYASLRPDMTYLVPLVYGVDSGTAFGTIPSYSKLHTGTATLTLTHNGIQLSQKQITIHTGFNYIDLTLTKPLLCGTVSEKDIDIPLAGLDITFTQGTQTQKVASDLNGQYASYQETTKSQVTDIDNGGTRHYEIEPVGNFANMTPKTPIQYNAVGDPAVSTIFDLLYPAAGTINFNANTKSSNGLFTKATDIKLEQKSPNKIVGKLYMDPQTDPHAFAGLTVKTYYKKSTDPVTMNWNEGQEVYISNDDGTFIMESVDQTPPHPGAEFKKGYIYRISASFSDDYSLPISDDQTLIFNDNYGITKDITLTLNDYHPPVMKYNLEATFLDTTGMQVSIANTVVELHQTYKDERGNQQSRLIGTQTTNEKGVTTFADLPETTDGSYYYVKLLDNDYFLADRDIANKIFTYGKTGSGSKDVDFQMEYVLAGRSQNVPQNIFKNFYWVGDPNYFSNNKGLYDQSSNIIDNELAILTNSYKSKHPSLPTQALIVQNEQLNAYAVPCADSTNVFDPSEKQNEIGVYTEMIDEYSTNNKLQLLSGVVAHEYGHTLFAEKTNINPNCGIKDIPNSESKYWDKVWALCNKYDLESCFSKVKDSNFEINNPNSGHPDDNPNELYASVFDDITMHPDEYKTMYSNEKDNFLKKLFKQMGQKAAAS